MSPLGETKRFGVEPIYKRYYRLMETLDLSKASDRVREKIKDYREKIMGIEVYQESTPRFSFLQYYKLSGLTWTEWQAASVDQKAQHIAFAILRNMEEVLRRNEEYSRSAQKKMAEKKKPDGNTQGVV
jgi:hypothetical protein